MEQAKMFDLSATDVFQWRRIPMKIQKLRSYQMIQLR